MFRVKHLITASSSCLFFVLSASTLAQEFDPKFLMLAQELAERIAQRLLSFRDKEGAIGYLVLDFGRQPGHTSQLGVHLADQLSDALKNDLAGLKPVERSKFYELWQREALDPALFEDDKTVLWAARALGARLAIVGTVELKGDSSFLLHVREIDVESEQIADAGEFLEWTEERRNLDLQPVAQAPPLAPWKEAARPGQQGISYPECVYCPNPPYSEEARKEGIEGTILTEVLIGEDGRVQHVRALKGLPFGLMTNALATIKTWKFKPMTGPDGKPVEVQTSVEATFRVFPHAQ